MSRSRLSFSRSAARTKSAMLTSSCRAARSISRNMAFGMRAWIGVLSAAVNTLPRLRFRRGLVCGSRGTRAMTLRLRWSAHAIREPTKAKTPSLWSRWFWFRSRVLRKLALLRDNILGSTLRPPSLLYDFIDFSRGNRHQQVAGRTPRSLRLRTSGRLQWSSQLPVRRDAALPGSGSSKKWPHRKFLKGACFVLYPKIAYRGCGLCLFASLRRSSLGAAVLC